MAAAWWADVEPADPWDAALAVAPPAGPLTDAEVHEALLVLADFADLKSPWTSGHSRAVAALAREACGPEAEAAALVHDLGGVAVPNTIWDKPGPLTRDERDRAETHALVTEQLLRRVPLHRDVGRRPRAPPTSASTAPATTGGPRRRSSTRSSGCWRPPTATRR